MFIAGASKNSAALVCDALNYDGRYRFMYEPFSDTSEPFSGVQHRLMWRTYLSPADKSIEFLSFAKRIVTGRTHTVQVDRWTPPGAYDRRLISEARLNLWLKWLHLHFEGMRMVLIMRHPCAVVSARLLLERSSRLKFILEDEEFVSRYLAPFASTVKAAKSPLERHALMWAIEHYVPLHELRNEVHIVSYEQFVADPKVEVERVLDYLGEFGRLGVPPLERVVRQHARTMNAWRDYLSPPNISRIMGIVSAFGLEDYAAPPEGVFHCQPEHPKDTDASTISEASKAVTASCLGSDDDSKSSLDAIQLNDIANELNDNLLRFVTYIAAWQRMLYKITDNDEWQMHDWDWLWPRHDCFKTIDKVWSRMRTLAAVEKGLYASIDAAYDTFQNGPPDLAACVAQWDGESNTFLRYMLGNLDRCLAGARARVQEVAQQLPDVGVLNSVALSH